MVPSKSNGGGPTKSVAASTSSSSTSKRLEVRFPVNTTWDFTLQSGEKVSGLVYCTDEISQSVVLQKALPHTTLASEIRIIHATRIKSAEQIKDPAATPTPLSAPLPKIQKKALEDKERRALRLAEESFRHINQKATPEGQAVFDRLLKACNEVVWKGESILVLNQIQVDPPYGPDKCKILQRQGSGVKNSLDDGSLDRVKKIVMAAAAASKP